MLKGLDILFEYKKVLFFIGVFVFEFKFIIVGKWLKYVIFKFKCIF